MSAWTDAFRESMTPYLTKIKSVIQPFQDFLDNGGEVGSGNNTIRLNNNELWFRAKDGGTDKKGFLFNCYDDGNAINLKFIKDDDSSEAIVWFTADGQVRGSDAVYDDSFITKGQLEGTQYVQTLQIVGVGNVTAAAVDLIDGDVEVPELGFQITPKLNGSYLKITLEPAGEIDGTIPWATGFKVKVFDGTTEIASSNYLSSNYKDNDWLSGGSFYPLSIGDNAGKILDVKVYVRSNNDENGIVQCGQSGDAWCYAEEIVGDISINIS